MMKPSENKKYVLNIAMLSTLYFITPILFVIGSITVFLYAEDIKDKKFYLYLVVLSHALLAYHWVPWNESFDLIRFHQQVNNIGAMNSIQILKNIFTPFAPFSFILKYLVFLSGNKDLLQFIVTGMTMYFFLKIYLMNYLKYNLSRIQGLVLFTILYVTLPLLRVISGLWSILSITYLSYIILMYQEGKIKNTKLYYFLCYLSTWIHFGAIIPLFLLLLHEIFSKYSLKIQIGSLIFVFISMLLVYPTSSFLYQITGLTTFKFMASRFYAYVFNQESFAYLNNYRFIIVEVSKTLLAFLFLYLYYAENKYENNSSSNTVFYQAIYVGLFTITFGLFVRILLRFTLMAVYLTTPFIAETLNKRLLSKGEKIILTSYIWLNGLYLIYALYNARLLIV